MLKKLNPVWLAAGAAVLVLCGSFCAAAEAVTETPQPVKNVIFMIGDGMGLGQVALARVKTLGPDGKLELEKSKHVALVRTHSASDLRTDSAAAATALASGFKANNGAIGVLPDGQWAKNLTEAARASGKKTGLVATSTISHATPAGFGTHVLSRGSEEDIALQLLQAKFDLLIGGGWNFWLPESAAGDKRKDGRNLLAEAANAGLAVAREEKELPAAGDKPVIALLAGGALNEENDPELLSRLTAKALGLLRCEQGFFVMIEGSQIDWACHANDANKMIKLVLAFDKAVKTALDFAATEGQTLVIVTADHETGGLIVSHGKPDGSDADADWEGKDHSALPVPLYAFGAGAENFRGVLDNTEVPALLAKLAGYGDFPKKTPAPAAGAKVGLDSSVPNN